MSAYVVQHDLFSATNPDERGFAPLAPQRIALDERSWVDYQPGWLTGSDAVFEEVAACVPWRAERRTMYDSVVDVPRLTCFLAANQALPHPALSTARELLSAHYRQELGEDFATTGLCLYRDERDSVAWHADRTGRSRTQDTMIAIVSLGTARTLALRPNGGHTAYRIPAGHGDLLVMGGACQREWEHAVPKSATSRGARISVQFRVQGVR